MSPDVEVMWTRWLSYRAGRESLPSLAYYCLTVAEASMVYRAREAGKNISYRDARREAADEYRIDLPVLDRLGDLSSDIGDAATSRKAHVKQRRSHTTQEEVWMVAAVKALMRRLGEWADDPNRPFPQLRLADLPQL